MGWGGGGYSKYWSREREIGSGMEVGIDGGIKKDFFLMFYRYIVFKPCGIIPNRQKKEERKKEKITFICLKLPRIIVLGRICAFIPPQPNPRRRRRTEDIMETTNSTLRISQSSLSCFPFFNQRTPFPSKCLKKSENISKIRVLSIRQIAERHFIPLGFI